jgi:hypothetical protein
MDSIGPLPGLATGKRPNQSEIGIGTYEKSKNGARENNSSGREGEMLRASYVEFNQERFYFSSSCSQDEERSNESCGHDQRPTTDRVLACNGRREAWFKPLACHSARTDA